MISRNASRLDLKKLLSPDGRKKAPNTNTLTAPQHSPVHNTNDTPTSISSQLTSPAQTRAQSNNTTPINSNKTVTRSVSAAYNNHVSPRGDTNGKAARSAVNTQISTDSSSSEDGTSLNGMRQRER
jgi:hypothetical protein